MSRLDDQRRAADFLTPSEMTWCGENAADRALVADLIAEVRAETYRDAAGRMRKASLVEHFSAHRDTNVLARVEHEIEALAKECAR